MSHGIFLLNFKYKLKPASSQNDLNCTQFFGAKRQMM